MRNVFDQYSQPENRLTHALMCTLAEDLPLRANFIRWVTGRKVNPRRIEVRQQSLPGQRMVLSENEPKQKKGLPDGCLSDASGWALLVESKVDATATLDQIARHVRSAKGKGLNEVFALVLTAKPVRWKPPAHVVVKSWSEVYEWLHGQDSRSQWIQRLIQYMEIAEARWASEGYLKEGTLTIFAGIPFAKSDEEYTFLQAKRVMKLLREKVITDDRLVRKLGMDQNSPGRPAKRGKQANRVWDFIGLATRKPSEAFTRNIHLTLGLAPDELETFVTLPNNAAAAIRRGVFGGCFEEFEAIVAEVTQGLMEATKPTPAALPRIIVMQRRYASQSSQPIADCQFRFDPRTAIALRSAAHRKVKLQPQWLRAAYDALTTRRSNLQFQIGVVFPYATCPKVATPDIARIVADVWLACRPLIVAGQNK